MTEAGRRLVNRAAWPTVFVVLASLLASPSFAHPFDADYYSSRAEVTAGADGLHLVVVVEVPTRRILEQFLELYGDPSALDESTDALFRRRQFERMAGELHLFSRGRRVAGEWRPVDSEANGRGTDTFFVYLFEFVPEDPAALRPEPGRQLSLRLDMEVFPREFIYLSASVETAPPWRLVENSAEKILAAASDELFDPATGRWSVDPRLRRLKLVFERWPEPAPEPEP